MISSFVISIVFFLLAKSGHGLPFAQTVLYSVAFTSGCWLVTAFVSPPTSRETLVAFYRKVHPAGPGWAPIRREAGPGAATATRGDHIGMATLGWVSGCAVIWSSLFAIGNYLYGRTGLALTLTAVFVLSGAILLYVIRHLWDRPEQAHSA